MTTTLEAIERQRRQVSLRTGASAVLYVGFLIASVISAIQYRRLEDVVTLTAIALVVAAFLMLPRDYVPALLLRKAQTPEEETGIENIRRYERFGLFIRIFYVAGAVLTIVVLPMLATPS